ncbi:acyl-CoA thioesterase [Novosphingobium sp. Leaf2]|uniref:acyl-CoA thioesterase n=1 Tax=Novosphingobium sp. Leaf2 TaxID=1735670 RepID=UPI0006F6143E|nr:acyl-CoA thioesterase [Novosphingobium sp. Leaf2]KQM21815.1 thioesterase [Novosphingobium sp. Leaf2]
MPKPDSALLDLARYPFSATIESRFGDMDINRHINNVALAAYLEDARVRFYEQTGFGGWSDGLATMIVSLAVEYLSEGQYPDPFTVFCAIEDLGRSSHRLVQLIVQDGRIIAFARSVLVAVGDNGPATLPEHFLENAKPWMLQV